VSKTNCNEPLLLKWSLCEVEVKVVSGFEFQFSVKFVAKINLFTGATRAFVAKYVKNDKIQMFNLLVNNTL
jgi:hypothetical protein